jgi:hypothetical protein
MTEWLLILLIDGSSVSAVHLVDKQSCHRAGKAFEKISYSEYKAYICVEVTKANK